MPEGDNTSMNKPTKKQTVLLEFIDDFTSAHNFSPSYREIMRAMGLSSVSAVAEHIENCVVAGFLKKTPGAPRSLEVIKPVDLSSTIADLSRLLSEEHLSPQEKNTLEDAIKILTQLRE